MRYDQCHLPFSFHIMKSGIEPSEYSTGVISLTKQIEVHVIAWLCVDSDYVHFIEHCAVLKLQLLSIVPSLSIHLFGFRVEVLIPKFQIYVDHRVLLGKVLGISGLKVVVTFKWIEGIVTKVGLEELC